jgi:hypothetical protein
MSFDADVVTKSKRGHYRSKEHLLTQKQLDGRSSAARQFTAIAEGIAQDLGGETNLSTVQRLLVEAFAGAGLHVRNINAHLMLAQPVDITEHATAISSIVRLASRIGTLRTPRDITPEAEADIDEFVRNHNALVEAGQHEA